MSDSWMIMPVMAAPELTQAAIADCLAQTVQPKLLIINQGVDTPFREGLERLSEGDPERIFVWSHMPPLISLSATWNRALQFCWECGADEAMVVNNDIRMDVHTYAVLKSVTDRGDALFVSAVGVTEEQYQGRVVPSGGAMLSRGGPDFSCFLISKEGHAKYPFDENFIPAFAEDLDMHRRYMLGGDGERIFSVNLPYHHIGGGSNTLKSMTPEARCAHERRIDQSRAYYARKWGGGVNHERYTIPFDASSDQDGVTTPELQAICQGVTR